MGVAQDLDRASALYGDACMDGFAMACHYLGNMYDTGDGMPQNIEAAMSLFEAACNQGFVASCHNLAVLMTKTQRSETTTTKKAVELLERACRQDDFLDSCASLGSLYLLGEVVPQDLSRATVLFEKACSDGKGRADVCDLLKDIPQLMLQSSGASSR